MSADDTKGEPAGAVSVYVDGEGQFDWLKHFRVRYGRITHLSALPRGMVGGKASVAFIGRLKDGTYAFLETSLRIALNAMTQWEAAYGIEADGSSAKRPTGLTAERLNAAMLIKLIRDREGHEVTYDIEELNAVMQDTTQAVEIQYGADGKTITFRTTRSE